MKSATLTNCVPSSRLGAQPSKPRLAFFRRLVLARHGCVELKLQQREAVHRHRRMQPGCFRAGLVVYAQVVALRTRREVQVGTVLNAQNHGSAPSVRSLCVARIFSGVTAEGSSRGRQAVKPSHCRHTRRHREGRTWHLRRVHCQPDASPDACLPTAHLVLGPAFSRQALANRHRNDRPGAQRRPATRIRISLSQVWSPACLPPASACLADTNPGSRTRVMRRKGLHQPRTVALLEVLRRNDRLSTRDAAASGTEAAQPDNAVKSLLSHLVIPTSGRAVPGAEPRLQTPRRQPRTQEITALGANQRRLAERMFGELVPRSVQAPALSCKPSTRSTRSGTAGGAGLRRTASAYPRAELFVRSSPKPGGPHCNC